MSSAPVADVNGRSLAQSACYAIDAAACRGRGVWWSEQESRWQAATTPREAEEASSPARQVCAGCPVSAAALCAIRAEADRYTGLAASRVYLKGVAHPPDTIFPIKRATRPATGATSPVLAP